MENFEADRISERYHSQQQTFKYSMRSSGQAQSSLLKLVCLCTSGTRGWMVLVVELESIVIVPTTTLTNKVHTNLSSKCSLFSNLRIQQNYIA